ncbi:hypothetical protein MBLNU457_g2482t1 [Dothideomycetes sp. NU457]
MASDTFHHRSTTKSTQKPFKAKHATKGALKEKSKGKVESFEKGVRRTTNQQTMSKLDRRNQAKQKRVAHNAEHVRTNSIFAGKDGAPRIAVVIPLCEDIDSESAVRSLVRSVDIEEDMPESGVWRLDVGRFKQKIQFVTLPQRSLWDALDACRIADFVIFAVSADEEVDSLGESMLRAIESQGVSNVVTVAQGLEKEGSLKKQHQVQASLKSFITHFFATQEKVHSLDSRQDCANVMRSLCTTTPKGIRWREDRSWMFVEDINWPANAPSSTVSFTGVVRGKGLKADRLVQVGDWGDFQIERIVAAPLPSDRKAGKEAMAVDGGEKQILEEPTAEQDDLADLAPEEAVMQDVDMPVSVAPSERKGVLLDDHHYFDKEEDLVIPKRLPRGTSKYQSAWYLGDISDSGSDMETVNGDDEDETMGGAAVPVDGLEGFDSAMREPTEGAPSEYPQSEMFMDPSPDDEAEQLAAYRAQRKNEAEEDLEFPDEIELNPHVLARERLARYRGLKSLRTSTWETEEDKPYEPLEWNRLLEIGNYNGAKNRMVNEALAGGVAPGTRVEVFIRLGDYSLSELQSLPRPQGLFSLLRHEHKRTAANYSFNLSSDYELPLRSKDDLIMQCGPRRLAINPLFSQAGNTPNNVHKFDRYVHPGRSAIATMIAPLIWGSVPTLFFKHNTETGAYDMIATGTSLAPSTSRVIAKRVILTGHPYKIHKKLVTVRYMFFNKEDVEWFKALQLWTKRGRSGFIKESLGTHGYFKATFDGKINPMDAVSVSLYKRVWPRDARVFRPGVEDPVEELVEAMAE